MRFFQLGVRAPQIGFGFFLTRDRISDPRQNDPHDDTARQSKNGHLDEHGQIETKATDQSVGNNLMDCRRQKNKHGRKPS
jgi:hypothetical protein